MSRVALCLLLGLLLLACARKSAEVLQRAIPGVYALACETECADEMATLITYRDDAGAIGLVTVAGSPAGCSAPPLRFFGPDGKERAAIPFQPVVPGSPEERRFNDIRRTQTANLHKAETSHCRDVKH